MIGILFDYNGVLMDDEVVHEAAFREVLATMGVSMTTADYVKYCMGRTDVDGWRDLRSAFPDTVGRRSVGELCRAKKAAYGSMVGEQDILYPGVRKVLENLGAVAEMVLVTSALRDELLPVLERYDLRQFFKGVVTADDVEKGKPDPEGYLKGFTMLGIGKEGVVVIEDAPSGVKAAKAAGFRCIAVLHTRAPEELAAADRSIVTIGELDIQVIRDVLNSEGRP